MFRSVTIVLTLVWLLQALPLAAARQATLDDILVAVKKGYASMHDLQADFRQRTYVAALKREEKGAGSLLLRKGDGSTKFRFNYVKPKQQIISNGSTVWYYLPENRQVILTDTAKLFAGGNGMAMSYLTGLGKLDVDFTVSLLTKTPDQKGNYLLELVPKKENAAVAKLQLSVSAAAVENAHNPDYREPFFPITASVLVDHLGNRTTIEYDKVRVNGGLGNERFSFKTPAGVDVIKQ